MEAEKQVIGADDVGELKEAEVKQWRPDPDMHATPERFNPANMPAFVTFTGADSVEYLEGMQKLQADFPGRVEFGLLFSYNQMGAPRYPDMHTIETLSQPDHGLNLSAHVCGQWARGIIGGAAPIGKAEEYIRNFKRLQVNTPMGLILDSENVRNANEYADARGLKLILQTRENFPDSGLWLFDQSGGNGIVPQAMPIPREPNAMVGYAGGLRPINVYPVARKVGAYCANYWMDMESGVRYPNGTFSLDACRAVLETLYT